MAFLPNVPSFFGLDLRTGSIMIAAMSLVHPLAYGCLCYMHTSYALLTIWILVVLYFVASWVLLLGLIQENLMLCTIWVWYSVMFVVLMLMIMVLLAYVYLSRKQTQRSIAAVVGIMWYMLMIYFILVVNSYRKELESVAKLKISRETIIGKTVENMEDNKIRSLERSARKSNEITTASTKQKGPIRTTTSTTEIHTVMNTEQPLETAILNTVYS